MSHLAMLEVGEIHTHTHTHAQTHAHTCTVTYTHTHTHTELSTINPASMVSISPNGSVTIYIVEVKELGSTCSFWRKFTLTLV